MKEPIYHPSAESLKVEDVMKAAQKFEGEEEAVLGGERDSYEVVWANGGSVRYEPYPLRIPVNKTTHRIRFENETELEVTVVIEPMI